MVPQGKGEVYNLPPKVGGVLLQVLPSTKSVETSKLTLSLHGKQPLDSALDIGSRVSSISFTNSIGLHLCAIYSAHQTTPRGQVTTSVPITYILSCTFNISKETPPYVTSTSPPPMIFHTTFSQCTHIAGALKLTAPANVMAASEKHIPTKLLIMVDGGLKTKAKKTCLLLTANLPLRTEYT